jgi:hypothetical protein
MRHDQRWSPTYRAVIRLAEPVTAPTGRINPASKLDTVQLMP